MEGEKNSYQDITYSVSTLTVMPLAYKFLSPPLFDPHKNFLHPGATASYFHCILVLDLYPIHVVSYHAHTFILLLTP